MDDRETNVAVDERPVVRPLTGNQQPSLDDEEWDDEEEIEVEDDLEDGDGSIEDDAVDETDGGDDEDEDDGFADERDPFAEAPAAEADEVRGAEGEVGEGRPPVTLDGAVFARIAECLRAAMAEADEKLGPARELAAREPFYAGFVKVLEAQRRRYTRALERVTAQAAAVAAAPVAPVAEAEPVTEAEPAAEPAELA